MQNKITNNISFGMALNMPSHKNLTKKFGVNIANEIELARPALKKLAEDADIFIKTTKDWFVPDNIACWGLMVTADTIKKPLKAKLSQLAKLYNLKEKTKGYVYIPVAESQNPISTDAKNASAKPNLNKIIIEKVTQAKSEIL